MDIAEEQVLLSMRLIVAAVLGALIGLERELAQHPAGMRTHLLVSLGSAMFAVVSAYGYSDVFEADPSALNNPQRIAAQVVSGIGFLGAGAIIHAGRWVRGLTTAASLWATAAVGLAVGSGQMFLAAVGTVLVVFSLGPVNHALGRRRGNRGRHLRLRVELSSVAGLGRVTAAAVSSGAEVMGLESRKLGKGRYELDLAVRLLGARTSGEIAAAVEAVEGADVVDVTDGTE